MSDRPLHVVILAAGEGKRMNSTRPKVLQPVGGRPMLAHLVDATLALDPAAVHVVVGHGADRVRAALEEAGDPRLGLVVQHQRLGTGHAVEQAMPGVDDPARVLVLPGDMPLVRTATLRRFADVTAPLGILTFEADDPSGYGRVLRDAKSRVTGIREQRDASPAEAAVREVNSGVLIADSGRLRGWLARLDNDNSQGEYYLTDCVGLAVADGETVEAVVCADGEELLGANDMAQLAQLERALQQRRRAALLAAGVRLPAPETVQVRGDVRAGRDVVVDAGVVLEGRVELGDGVEIGTGCVVRDSRLSSRIACSTASRPPARRAWARLPGSARARCWPPACASVISSRPRTRVSAPAPRPATWLTSATPASVPGPTWAPVPSPAITTVPPSTGPRSAPTLSSAPTPHWSRR